MRPPGNWAKSRDILVNSNLAVPCRHCDIPIMLFRDRDSLLWYHLYVPSAFWTLCPNDPEEALDGLTTAGQATTRPEPWSSFRAETVVADLEAIVAGLSIPGSTLDPHCILKQCDLT